MIYYLGIVRKGHEPFGHLDGQGHRKRTDHRWAVQLSRQPELILAGIQPWTAITFGQAHDEYRFEPLELAFAALNEEPDMHGGKAWDEYGSPLFNRCC